MNCYDLLEIQPTASEEVIRMAYKALVKKYHPDVYEGDKADAEDILQKINVAYEILSDKEKRAKYGTVKRAVLKRRKKQKSVIGSMRRNFFGCHDNIR